MVPAMCGSVEAGWWISHLPGAKICGEAHLSVKVPEVDIAGLTILVEIVGV